MSQALWDMLTIHTKSDELQKLSPSLQQKLRHLSGELAVVLRASDAAARTEILTRLCTEVLGHAAELEAATSGANSTNTGHPPTGKEPGEDPRRGQIHPEILEWARQQLNEEEAVAGLREIRETGGLELADFIHELEQEATPRE